MSWNPSSVDALRRVFVEGLAARDISEPLASFDAGTPATEVLRQMLDEDWDLVGVRRRGLVVGYADRDALGGGLCGDRVRPFEEESVVSGAASLADVVLRLSRLPRLFVETLGAVNGIVTLSDLQKPPMRMWLFGMITLVEMRMGALVEAFCKGDTWKEFLSEGRLQKAAALLEERRRRNQSPRLIDCLQFSDKGQIIARNEAIRSVTRFASRRKVEEICRALESLRNNLAHAQDIISCDWETIVALAKDLDNVISGNAQVVENPGRGPHPTADDAN
jgi:hypothetical protein